MWNEDKVGASLAFFGSIALGIGTSMHPMHADASNTAAVFAEYAVAPNWIVGHLLQFTGSLLLLGFLLILSRQVRASSGMRQLATGGAIATLAVAAVMQAVDGIALKGMVDAWQAAPAADKPAAFSLALAMRQIELGLTSALTMLFGATCAAYGLILHGDGRYPRWIGGAAFAGGAGFAGAGVMLARGGFASYAMDILMPASLMVIAFLTGVAALHWRRGTMQPPPAQQPPGT